MIQFKKKIVSRKKSCKMEDFFDFEDGFSDIIAISIIQNEAAPSN